MIDHLYAFWVDVCGYALAKLMTVIQVKKKVKPYSDDAMHIIFREREVFTYPVTHCLPILQPSQNLDVLCFATKGNRKPFLEQIENS